MQTDLQFNAIIEFWPSRRELWRDMAAYHPDLAYETVRSWHIRNSIPSKYWDALILLAVKRGYRGVTHKALAHAASGREAPAEEIAKVEPPQLVNAA